MGAMWAGDERRWSHGIGSSLRALIRECRETSQTLVTMADEGAVKVAVRVRPLNKR